MPHTKIKWTVLGQRSHPGRPGNRIASEASGVIWLQSVHEIGCSQGLSRATKFRYLGSESRMRNKGSDMGVRAVERKEKADQSYYCAEGMDRPGLGLELWKFISLRNNKHCSERVPVQKTTSDLSMYVCVYIYI